MENLTKSRLTVLRELLKLSQQEFAKEARISQGTLSLLESGKSRLSLETIQKISQSFNVNCNWLINGRNDIFLDENSAEKSVLPQTFITRDFNNQLLIPLIREEAHAGYIDNFNNEEFLCALDVYRIPGYESGNYRLFEIEGDSMLPTIYPREIVITALAADWQKLENGRLCIVISDDGIVAKRVYFHEEDHEMIILKSDNPQYKTFSLRSSHIKEAWTIEAKITNVFSQDHLIDAKKIKTLEEDILELKTTMHHFLPDKAKE